MEQIKTKDTFIVQIVNCQHATWQGTITWTNGQVFEHFRSALEMIRLIDSVVGKEQATNHIDEKKKASMGDDKKSERRKKKVSLPNSNKLNHRL